MKAPDRLLGVETGIVVEEGAAHRVVDHFEFRGLNARRRCWSMWPHTHAMPHRSLPECFFSAPNARPTDPPTRLVGLDRLPARSADRIPGLYSTGLRLPPLELSLNQSRDNVRHCHGRLPTKDALGLGGIPGADLNVGSSK